MALLAAALLAFALGNARARSAVPEPALWLVALAAWIGGVAVLREPAFVQLPLAGVVYLLAAAAACWLGRSLADQLGAEQVADVLATALLAGAAANAAIAVLQFAGIDLWGLIARSFSPRPVGHVGQSNLLASYLAVGAASLLYLWTRGRLSTGWSVAAGVLLVAGSACAQSRSTLMYAAALAVLALLLHPDRRRSALGLSVLLAAATLAAPATLERLAGSYEPRLDLWPLALRLFLDSPWLGSGWGEFAGAAFQAGLPAALEAHVRPWSSPHNVLLQVLAEAGLVGALLVAGALLRWAWPVGKALLSGLSLPTWWAAACVSVMTLHALVEYPLWYAHVLVLILLIAGTASRGATELSGKAARVVAVAAAMLLGALLAWTFADHQRLARSALLASGLTLAPAEQLAEARGELRGLERGPLGAHAALWGLHPGSDPALGERVLRRWPTMRTVARQAAALERAGEHERARRLVEHVRRTMPQGMETLERELRAAR